MENKINIVEILKNCPKATELYSPICGECRVFKIHDHLGFDVINGTDDIFNFSYDGRYNLLGECCIFPSKENRDWNTFQRPYKDGDIVVAEYKEIFQMFVLKSQTTNTTGYCYTGYDFDDNSFFDEGMWAFSRLATEEEKEKLFQVIKDNGYRWNAETKTLEKLIEPKFKVGDNINIIKDLFKFPYVVKSTYPEYYELTTITGKTIELPIKEQDDWELLSNNPDKFDPTALKPFDKVLVRDNDTQKWTVDLFSFFDKSIIYPYSCVGHYANQCIPYEGNEHLLGTTNDCYEYYKNW